MFERGQAISIDFVMATFVFIILLIAINSVWYSNIVEIDQRSNLHRMISQARFVSDMLVNSSGYPVNWQSDMANAQTLGLAEVSKPRKLSQAKLNAFFAGPYVTLQEKLGIEGFGCKFSLLNTDETVISSIGEDFNGTYLTIEDRVIRVGGNTRIFRIEAWV